MQALIKPVPVAAVTVLTGQPLDGSPASTARVIRQEEALAR
jgi:hypothetical protein